MTREEFMDIVYSELHSDGDNYRANRIIDAADDYAEEQSRWIPTSERLPEEDGDYFVTLENGVVTKLGYSTTQRTTYPKGFYYISNGFSWRQKINPVVAWMPLPEPWKGEE